VSTPSRLRLKAQLVSRPEERAHSKPFAKLWVDSGVLHLDAPFDYAVPLKFSDEVQVGVRVQVPFNGREVEAIVLERLDSTSVTGVIKEITKVLSPHPVATVGSLELFAAVAQHWACNPYDVVRSAIPARVASVDKLSPVQPLSTFSSSTDREVDRFVAFEPVIDPAEQCADLVLQKAESGSILVLAPDESDVDAICESLLKSNLDYIRLDSSLSRADRYSNFLKLIGSSNCIVVGARSAVFAPIPHLKCVILYKESSFDHFEKRSPGWNVRDVLSLRSELEDFQRIYMGYVPSLDISLLIESAKLKYILHSHQLKVKSFSSNDGSLLPDRIFKEIRKGLTLGPVLFIVPRKGYGNALLCASCKNVAVCTCGARLSVTSKNADPICLLCHTTYPDWSCSWCHSKKQYLGARGIDRAGEEISRAFPGLPLLLSFGDVIKTSVENKPALVLATPGSAPKVKGGYGAVVILEGWKFFAHADLRSQERARELFFETAAMASANADVLLSIDESHPIVSSLVRWSPGAMIRRELSERLEIPLPPYVSSVTISGEAKDFSVIASGLRKAIEDGRLPREIKIFGPSEESRNIAKIVMYCPPDKRADLADFLLELTRRRSIAKKDYLTIRFDPYSL
jgi:primosomal protein N' (replication factor Y)